MKQINTIDSTKMGEVMKQAKSIYGCSSFIETEDFKGFESKNKEGNKMFFYPNQEKTKTEVFVA